MTTSFHLDEGMLVDGPLHLLHPVRDPATFVFGDVHAFVNEHLANLFAHPVRDGDATFKWCPHWAEHPGAHARLTALWQAWEALHDGTGTGPSAWWRDHAEPTMRALTHPEGPFARCGPTRHQLPPWPCPPRTKPVEPDPDAGEDHARGPGGRADTPGAPGLPATRTGKQRRSACTGRSAAFR